MTARNLTVEITEWMIESRSGGTLAEIAGSIHARRVDVLNVLRSESRFVVDRTTGRKIWFAPSTTRGTARNGTPRPPTHNELILRVLADGKWHTGAEIHRQVFCVLHSRISQLRQRGYTIEHRGAGGGTTNHEYRLVASPEAVEVAA